MQTLFPNYKIDLENGKIWSNKYKRYIGSLINGYYEVSVYDVFKNHYKRVHEIILAEGLQLPKHLWPVDEKGKRYICDHILPVKNGGTDVFKNLHLIPEGDNPKNPISRKNNSSGHKGQHSSPATEFKKGQTPWNTKTVFQYTLENELVAVWESGTVAAKELGFTQGCIASACRNEYYGTNIYKGYKWSYEPL